jgi:hypothetical protein
MLALFCPRAVHATWVQGDTLQEGHWCAERACEKFGAKVVKAPSPSYPGLPSPGDLASPWDQHTTSWSALTSPLGGRNYYSVITAEETEAWVVKPLAMVHG